MTSTTDSPSRFLGRLQNDHPNNNIHYYRDFSSVSTVPTLPQQLETAQVRVGSCGPITGGATPVFADIDLHAQCGVGITSQEVDEQRAGYWLMRECDTNYYGQYVYILKNTLNAQVTWFSLCEVEVWGIDSKSFILNLTFLVRDQSYCRSTGSN